MNEGPLSFLEHSRNFYVKILRKTMVLEILQKVPDECRISCDIEQIVLRGDQLFTNGDNGSIKIWNISDLTVVGELNANRGGVCALAANGDRLYAAMADASIVIWDIDKRSIIKEMTGHEEAVKVIRFHGNRMYSGDFAGKILVWENDEYLSTLEMYEEVWDLIVHGEKLYTSRDRDLTVHTLGRKDQKHLMNLHAVEGHGPICIAAEKLCFLTRDGLSIRIHDNAKPGYPEIAIIKGHERIINAMTSSSDGKRLYSAGWDSMLRSWDLSSFQQLSQLNLDAPINAIYINDDGILFVGGNDGFITKIADN